MRSVASELLSVVTVLTIPLGIASVFPRAAISFMASRPATAADGRSASIIFLDEADVARMMRAARTMSRSEGNGHSRIDLLAAELPGADELPMAAIGFGRRSNPGVSSVPVVENGISPFLPSRRAAAPVRISAETEKEEPVFSRNELLKLN